MRDFRSVDTELDALDPRGTHAQLGGSLAERRPVADCDAMLAELSAPITGASRASRRSVAPFAISADSGGESLEGLFDDVAGAPAESRPISIAAPAASFLSSSSDSASEPSLEELLEAGDSGESASERAATDDEPEIEIEEDEFAALDSLEIELDD